MKRNLLKSLALVAALTMTLSLTACSPKADTPGTNTEESADLSDEDYAAKVTEIYTAIQTDSMTALEGIDMTDSTAIAEATIKMSETIKPYYEELGALKTSGKYADAQAQIATGAAASIKVLDYTIELMELGSDPANASSEEATKKTEEIQSEIATLATDLNQLTTGISTVMADGTAPVETPAE